MRAFGTASAVFALLAALAAPAIAQTGQAPNQLLPLTCNSSVTVFVASGADYHPFSLDISMMSGNTRITMNTCSSKVSDPDLCLDREYIDDDQFATSGQTGDCLVRYDGVGGAATNTAPPGATWGLGENVTYVLAPGVYPIQIGTYGTGTGNVSLIVNCSAELVDPVTTLRQNGTAQCYGNRSVLTASPTPDPTVAPTPSPTTRPTTWFQAPAVGIRANYNGTLYMLAEARQVGDLYQPNLATAPGGTPSVSSQSPIPAGMDDLVPLVATASLRIWAAGGDESPAPRTTVRVWFKGGPALAGQTFQAHLHNDSCRVQGQAFAGDHYRNDPSGSADAVNENWPTVNCDNTSTCVGNATTLWEPTVAAIEKGLSVVIHDTPSRRRFSTDGPGNPYLCADLIGPPPIPVNNSLAERETRQICQTVINVVYSSPISGVVLGPIVLGIGENGAVISLFPGTFTATAEMRLCDGRGLLLPDVAFRGETIVDFTASTSGQRRSIVIFAIDTRTPDELSPYEQNFAPIITSIEINPQTVAIGQTATITASGYEVNGGDFIRSMDLDVFDRTAETRLLHSESEVYQRDRTRRKAFDFTPMESHFAGNTSSAHDLVGRVTATDDFNLTGSAEISFTVNRLEMVEIGAVALRRPMVALDPRKQNHSTAHGGSPAVVKLDVFDRDFIDPPQLRSGLLYQEKLTYRIEIFGNATIPGRNGNTVENPSCQPADASGGCDYIKCTCTETVDSAGNKGCEEIVVSNITTTGGGEWTFKWNPWDNQAAATGRSMPADYGTTYCQLMVYFVDNTGSVNISDSFVNVSTSTSIDIEGLHTSTVSVLLEADPNYRREFNRAPSVRYFWGAHLDLDLNNPPVTDTTVTVIFQDADADGRPLGRPTTALGYLKQTGVTGQPDMQCATPGRSTRTPQACFERFTTSDVVTVNQNDTGLAGGVFRDDWTFNGARVLRAAAPSSEVDVYIEMTDAVSGYVGYHHVAFLRQATRRRRRDAAAAGPQAQAMTLTIDADGQLSGSMVFPDAWVSDDGDGDTGVIQVPGVTTPATTPAHEEDDADDDDGSTDRQLVMTLVLVCGVGCLCVLGAAICLAYRHKMLVVVLDKNGDNKGHATEFAEAADGSDSGAVRFVGTQSSSC